MFSVFLGNQPEKFLKKCEPKVRERVLELAKFLKENPVPSKDYDVRKIEGTDQRYRIRLSSYRVSYEVLWTQKEVWVFQIERRDETTYK